MSHRTSRRRPRQFESLESRHLLDSTVVFSELMYNPPVDGELEWIELHNEMAIDMDISNWRFDGIDFQFPHDIFAFFRVRVDGTEFDTAGEFDTEHRQEHGRNGHMREE